ncbi:DivIVA domain-containing protein [Luteipulveratus mongoliensis]|uniref:DivIVA domain-containing protein n=1 Tax=Luteipulveratus mongoliensis TaxID=571913 RepID=UPI000697D4C0|nr:DivIVA domain-containing protein [Luteipulveratus mongoliensis]
MALAPEDVVKKEFTKPKGFGRSGYDEIQVDDFLDEIVVELRRLNAENEDLTSKLEECRRSKGLSGREQAGASPSSGASAVPGLTPVAAGGRDADKVSGDLSAAQDRLAAVKAETARAEESARAAKDAQQQVEAQAKQAQDRLVALRNEIEKAEAAERDARQRAERATATANSAGQQAAAPAAFAPPSPQQPQTTTADSDAAGVIALAQRLHDEHVSEGQSTRSRLISEGEQHRDKVVGEATSKRDDLLKQGQSKYDELIRTAQARHDELISVGQNKHDSLIKDATDRSNTMVGDAENKKSTILSQLNTERDRLTSDIEQLRTFERDYRTKLKGYIEGQLKQLDHAPIDSEKGAGNIAKA